MSYIVNQDIVDRVGNDTAAQLTTDTGTTPDQAVLDEVRTSAEDDVDGWLAKRVLAPVDVSGDTKLASFLKTLALDIAEFRLRNLRHPVPEATIAMHKAKIDWLKAFAKGEANLPGAVTPASTTSDDPAPSWGSATAGGVEGEL